MITLQMVYHQDDPTAGESAREDPSDRVCRTIVSRIDELEETVKENVSTQLDKMEGGGGKRKESLDNKSNIAVFMREQTLFQKEMKKQMDQMMKMLSELQSGGGMIMNQLNYEAAGSDADSEPGSPLIRILSSDDQSSVGSGSSGEGSQVPLIAQALSKLSSSRAQVDTRRSITPSSNRGKDDEANKMFIPKPTSDAQPKREIQWARSPQMNGSAGGTPHDGPGETDEPPAGNEGDGPPPPDPPPPPTEGVEPGSTLRFYPAIPLAYSAESELRLLPSMPDLPDYEDIQMVNVDASHREEDEDNMRRLLDY